LAHHHRPSGVAPSSHDAGAPTPSFPAGPADGGAESSVHPHFPRLVPEFHIPESFARPLIYPQVRITVAADGAAPREATQTIALAAGAWTADAPWSWHRLLTDEHGSAGRARAGGSRRRGRRGGRHRGRAPPPRHPLASALTAPRVQPGDHDRPGSCATPLDLTVLCVGAILGKSASSSAWSGADEGIRTLGLRLTRRDAVAVRQRKEKRSLARPRKVACGQVKRLPATAAAGDLSAAIRRRERRRPGPAWPRSRGHRRRTPLPLNMAAGADEADTRWVRCPLKAEIGSGPCGAADGAKGGLL
jgi:hypothetical protein